MVMLRENALTEAQIQTQAQSESPSTDQVRYTEPVVSPATVDECAIIAQALGQCSRWEKGVGSMLRLKAVEGPKAVSSGGPSVIQRQ
ncbi:hypothetical protein PanWU01x14_014110 [Parasponia andersonii]|uniref:Uncharacterized protein n=1 Tax=Parasponia andersonii TaxID=3476 RepID=A0A2P5E169_PARAD|nr:hypothetical protein PanWU01x14_014110 [Parasponia andersonii]